MQATEGRSARVLIAARVRLYREGVGEILGRERGIEIAGLVGDADVARQARELAADVVLVDAGIAGRAAVIRELAQLSPPVKIVALGFPESEHEIVTLAEAGISGFVGSDSSLAELVATIRAQARGDLLCSPRTAGILLRHVATLASGTPAGDRLTARERDVASLLTDGLSNKQIGVRLQIALPTVKQHVHHILGKLGVARRAEAVACLGRDDTPRVDAVRD
jgi:two-component system, NarL family, nitrate/nitrite response regulator NarL